MLEDMKVRVEVWPLAADQASLWLLSGDDAWRNGNVPADGDVHFEVVSLLTDHGIWQADTTALHSTSWRPDGPAIVVTYMAVVSVPGFIKDRWPHARPVTREFADAVGKPPTHAAADAPVPRFCDVLLHGLRHLAYLAERDQETAEAMGALWREHLAPLEPVLATMYSERHVAA